MKTFLTILGIGVVVWVLYKSYIYVNAYWIMYEYLKGRDEDGKE